MERVFTDVRTLDDVIENCTRDCVDMLEDATLLNHLKLIKFDIVLVDAFVVNKCLLLIPHILRIFSLYLVIFILQHGFLRMICSVIEESKVIFLTLVRTVNMKLFIMVYQWLQNLYSGIGLVKHCYSEAYALEY